MIIALAGTRRLCLWLKLLIAVLSLGAAPAASAAVFYVSSTPGELDPATRVRIATPRPVQLLFTFQTSGAPNMRATNQIKEQVTNEVRASGLFSEISQAPVAGGAVLSITMNNIPEPHAASRGVAVGLTLGLHGATVTDSYVTTLDYLSGPDATPIHRSVDHAIRASMGHTDPPENSIRMRNAQEAVATMIRQSLAHGLNAVGSDPGFVPSAATTPAPDPAAHP
jgi:hypothetical protein